MATKRSDWRRYMTPLLATASPGRASRPLVAMRQRAVTWRKLAMAYSPSPLTETTDEQLK